MTTDTSGKCGNCGTRYTMAASGEYATYQRPRLGAQRLGEARNADTWTDGNLLIWDCPFCGHTERRTREQKWQDYCPICNRMIALTRDNRLYPHGPRRRRCPASGQPINEVVLPTARP